MQTFYLWLRRLVPLLVPLLLLVTVGFVQRPDGRLHVFFLPTSGDAALVQTPDGSTILIDGGSDPATVATLLGRRMPFWRRELAAVVLTTPRNSWLPGQVAALARYHASVAFAPPVSSRGALVAEWRRLLAEGATAVCVAQPGSRIVVDGVTLVALDAGDGETSGLAFRLQYGAVRLLFDGAAGEDEDERLAKVTGRTEVIVFPWQRPLPEELLARLQPRILVFTDGVQVDKPAELSTVDRSVGGAAVYHEAIHGEIELISDGTRFVVTTERGSTP